MWLPGPVYERVPQFWLLLGILFMTSGAYLGFDYELTFLYFGVGVLCVVWSIGIFVVRSRNRCDPTRKPMRIIKDEQPAEETTAQPG